MDPQNTPQQIQNTLEEQAPVFSSPIQDQQQISPTQLTPKKSKRFVWIIAAVVALLVGIGIGIFFKI